jgi:hypothetical protein
MSNNLFQFNFEHDQQPTENSYCISDVQWVYINDINQGNYSNGFINFTNVSVIGSDVSKQYDWSQAYLAIPITVTVVPDGTLLTTVIDPVNANALSIKSNACLVDWVSCKFNGVSVTRNSYYNHLLMNENIKMYSDDKFKIYGDILNHSWDTGNSIGLIGTAGEYNNCTNLATGLVAQGNRPGTIPNLGHRARCAKTNIDMTDNTNSSLAQFLLGNSDLTPNSRQTQIGSTTILNNENQNSLVYQGTDGLCFQSISLIPLSELHDFFKQMPSVASSTGFELRLQMNLSKENSYQIRYNAIANATTVANRVTSNQIVGHCAPFMLANPSTDGSTGLRTAGTGLINGTMTIRANIGWKNETGQLAAFQGSTGNPVRIFLPSINYTNDYIKQIITQPQYSLKYTDFYVDSDLNKSQGSSVSRLFNVQLSRVRTLFIIPFLSSPTNAFPSPTNSPISSAPVTCSIARLRNFNIQIGGQNIYNEPQNFNYQFYNNNTLSLMADVNGNSLKSKFFSGQISKSQWESGYNVYSINLQKVQDEITDSLMKSFQLIFQIDGTAGLSYDFYYIITYQSELFLDRSTGTITNSV